MKRKTSRTLPPLIFLAVFAAAAALVMLLWNALIPVIIGWSAVTFWQAAGLIVLCRLLLGGFGFMKNGAFFPGRPRPDREKMEKIHQRFRSMDPDERREFIRRRMRDMAEPEPDKPE